MVNITVSDGLISGISPARADARAVDLGGRLVMMAPAEPHAHLDKAFTADRFPNPTGDLPSAIEAIRAGRHSVLVEDIVSRASHGVRRLVASGTTAIRTHVDVEIGGGLASVEALLEVRDALGHLADIQIVCLSHPLTGPDGPEGRRLMQRALDAGVDVVGSCPHIEDDPVGAIELTLACAADLGVPADLHFDEVLDPTVQHLPELARQVERRGLGGRVVASHCVSHGLLPADEQRVVARMLTGAGVAVIANPRTNLFLQARGIEQAPPRGLAGIRALLDEGVNVAAGADNVQDPFYPVGRSDPLETASLLVAVGHLTVDEAATLVGPAARKVMGLAHASQVEVGAPAELVAIPAMSVREAIADQSADRIVFHRGRQVARTTVHAWVAG